MAWVRGLQDKEGVLQGCWLDVKAVFTTQPWGDMTQLLQDWI